MEGGGLVAKATMNSQNKATIYIPGIRVSCLS